MSMVFRISYQHHQVLPGLVLALLVPLVPRAVGVSKVQWERFAAKKLLLWIVVLKVGC